MVVLAPGLHEHGAIHLRSDVTLHLEDGAVLRALPDYAAFAGAVSDVVAENSDRAFLLARGQHDLAITGKGVIDGQGLLWCSEVDPRSGARVPARLRPRMLVVEDCTGFALSGVTLRQSPMWTVHLIASRNLTLRDLQIDNDMAQPNTDGVVIDSCRAVLIENVTIRAADDSICLKTSARRDGHTHGPCEDITIRRVQAESRGAAFKIGSESHDDFRRVRFEDCTAIEATRAINIMLRDGGSAFDITFHNIHATTREVPLGYWGTGEALSLTILRRDPDGRPAGQIEGLRISGLSGVMEGALQIIALDGGRISGLYLSDIALEQRQGPHGSGRYSDLRPTPFGLTLPEGATGLGNAWYTYADGRVGGYVPYPGGQPAIFIRSDEPVALENVAITRPDPLPQGWSHEPIIYEKAAFAVI